MTTSTEKVILILEDSPDVANYVIDLLQKESYKCVHFSCMASAKKYSDCNKHNILLYLLDYSLNVNENTNQDGFLFCQYIKKNLKLKTPVMMLTANPSKDTTVACLESGADDFLNKPFYNKELLARVKNLIINTPTVEPVTLASKMTLLELKIDSNEYSVVYNTENLNFTKSEFELFTFMLANMGKILSRQELIRHIQGENVHVTNRTIDTHVVSMRKKLSMYPTLISSKRGFGYGIIRY